MAGGIVPNRRQFLGEAVEGPDGSHSDYTSDPGSDPMDIRDSGEELEERLWEQARAAAAQGPGNGDILTPEELARTWQRQELA
jgi:hypothetical protein